MAGRFEAELAEAGLDVTYVHLDVTSEDEWNAAVSAAVSAYGHLDTLVNNAGILIRKGIEDTTVEDWDRIMDINAKGVFLGTKAAIPAIREAGGGSIINISSTAGLVGSPEGSSSYTATKGAVRLLTKSTRHPVRLRRHPVQLRASRPHRHRNDPRHLFRPRPLGGPHAAAASQAGRYAGGHRLRRGFTWHQMSRHSLLAQSWSLTAAPLPSRQRTKTTPPKSPLP